MFERTVKKGPVFQKLREDVEEAAAHHGMQDVFKLRAADLFRVLDIERHGEPRILPTDTRGPVTRPAGLSDLVARLSRCPDLDTLVGATVDGLDELLGYPHSLLMLLDEEGGRLFTIASHGYPAEGVGSEVPVGEGTIGMAAARSSPIRIGNLRQMRKYSTSVKRAFEEEGYVGPGRDVPLPGLERRRESTGGARDRAGSARRRAHGGEPALGGVRRSRRVGARRGRVVRGERDRDRPVASSATRRRLRRSPPPGRSRRRVRATFVRYFAVDGSIFLDGDYLIRGVAGRIFWSLLEQYVASGRVDFTNKEVRLDPRLELPGFRDNLDTRLILLKRRLDERDAPIRIEKTGRGRFCLIVDGAIHLDQPAP